MSHAWRDGMRSFFRERVFLCVPLLLSLVFPVSAYALSVDKANYNTGDTVYVTCASTRHAYETYDITSGIDGGAGNGGDIGVNGCSGSGLIFASQDAHTYSILELDRGNSCSGEDYTECAIEPFTWSEVNFTVGSGATPGTVGRSTFPLATNKNTYSPGEPVTVTCSYARGEFEIYDITSGIDGLVSKGGDLGLFECSNATISLPTAADHSYAVLELAYGSSCESEDYGDCSGEDFARDEIGFSVSADTGGGSTPALEGMSKSTYAPGETPLLTCNVGTDAFQVYDITTGIDGLIDNGGNVGSGNCATPAVLSFDFSPTHSYMVVEVSNGFSCNADDYAACLSESFTRKSFSFDISALPPARRTISYPPDVKISFPIAGAVFSRYANIRYSATDQNDLDTPQVKAALGLGDHPVSIYYSDKISTWSHEFISPEDKVLIASSLSATGTYVWDASALMPGVPYRVIVDALDQGNVLGEYVSDAFYVDFTAPRFIVSTDPSITRGEDVNITVQPDEKLKEPPHVSVIQEGAEARDVKMVLKDDAYQGVYKVLSGHDGIAKISVEGTDPAGNVGTTTLSGGTFAVGVNPPPTPHITSPKKNLLVSTSTIAVSGTTRFDTSIILTVNGADIYTATTSKDGTFTVPKIRLSKTFNRGLNTISVVAKDKTGVLSAPATLQIRYNIAPTVALVAPLRDATIRGVTSLVASSTDENHDPLLYTYQVIAEKDYDDTLPATSTKNRWTTVGELLTSSKYSWDTSEADDGAYYLRIIVTDGIAKAYSETRHVIVHNTLPYFRFQDGRKTVVGKAPAIVTGRVLEPGSLAGSSISTVEYSLDNGRTWKPVQINPGNPQATFSVTFSDLKREGTYGVLWHVKDSRGLIGHANHPVVIDATPPLSPSITSPRGNIITDDNDEDPITQGVQLSVSVNAEPESAVTLSVDGATTTERVDIDGSATFRNVTVGARGTHTFSVYAVDEAGNGSVVSSRYYIYDNPPEASFLEPKPSRGLAGTAHVSWRVDDIDGDSTHAALSYRKGTGAFIALPIDAAQNSYLWDVSKFSEGGDYELRLLVTDGLATSSQTIGFYIDKTPPTLQSFKLDTDTLGAKGVLSGRGTATDALSGIEYVEYAITPVSSAPDAQKEWFTALVTKGYLKKQASYVIRSPQRLSDGEYEVTARAVDAAGNTSDEMTQKLTVDTTPPRVGSFLSSVHGVQISPDKDGVLSLYADSDFTLGVSLEDDTASSSVYFQGNTYPLVYDVASGLWRGDVSIHGQGHSGITISARDRLGNSIKNVTLGAVEALPHGQVLITTDGSPLPLSGAHMKVLSLNKETGRYVSSSESSGGDIVTGNDGAYELVLPAGTFKLVLQAAGYQTVEKEITLERTTLITETFTTQKISPIQQMVQNVFDYISYSL